MCPRRATFLPVNCWFIELALLISIWSRQSEHHRVACSRHDAAGEHHRVVCSRHDAAGEHHHHRVTYSRHDAAGEHHRVTFLTHVMSAIL